VGATPVKLMIGCSATWILLPWLFEKWGLVIDGDIAEHGPTVGQGSYAKIAESRLATQEDMRLNADIVVK
jgi:hypothetical protein